MKIRRTLKLLAKTLNNQWRRHFCNFGKNRFGLVSSIKQSCEICENDVPK